MVSRFRHVDSLYDDAVLVKTLEMEGFRSFLQHSFQVCVQR